jgi:hypothetical protein
MLIRSPAPKGAEPFLSGATLPQPFPFDIHPQPSPVVGLIAAALGGETLHDYCLTHHLRLEISLSCRQLKNSFQMISSLFPYNKWLLNGS